jgi:hypothetical protein
MAAILLQSGIAVALSSVMRKEDLMVDKFNPTSQFHPYQPADAVPVAERETGGYLDKVRGLAASKPGLVLGGIAAAAIGLGLLRGKRS